MAEFIVNNAWCARKIIGHALSESDGVPYQFSVDVVSSYSTPVSDEDMGQTCDGCGIQFERCPCKACGKRSECCCNIDAEQRGKCSMFKEFLDGKYMHQFEECENCANRDEDCANYLGDADGWCRNFVSNTSDELPEAKPE